MKHVPNHQPHQAYVRKYHGISPQNMALNATGPQFETTNQHNYPILTASTAMNPARPHESPSSAGVPRPALHGPGERCGQPHGI